jgi:ornithine--oxo-acid transaminase
MDFDLPALLAAHRGDGYELYGKYLNAQQPRMLHAIGFDKVYERGEGAYLYDADGQAYADFLAGFGVFAAGRNHPVIRQALHDALDAELPDWTQFDCGPLPGLLAERLLAKAPGLDRVFFCNSGTEAVESALKFARYATGRGRVLYCDHAFHGLTTGSLSVNGSAEFRRGFDPLLPDAPIPLGDLEALAAELKRGDVAALIIEPIQGKGVHMPPDGFLTAAAKLLHEYGALLIADEVQTGFGRTGTFFAYQHEEVVPDIVTVAKALSGGFVPVGAMLAKGPIFEKVFSNMDRVMVHSTTFKGGVLAMTAGLAALQVHDDEHLTENAARTGEALKAGLTAIMGKYDVLADVRGRGLMIGLEFDKPSALRARTSWNMLQKARVGLFAQMVVVALFQRHRILTQVSGDHMEVIKLIPPLMIGDTEVKLFTEGFAEVLEDASKGTGLMWDFGRTLIKQAVRS